MRLPMPSLLLLAAAPLWGGDWPQWRGADGSARARADHLEGAATLDLDPAWRAGLGSGYSAIVVADGRVFGLGASERSDWVVAFDEATGERLWRYRLGATFEGRSGSDDGPIATPAYADGTLVAYSAKGALVALDAATGAERWRHEVVEEFGAEPPFYGISSSPIVIGDAVVAMTGEEAGIVSSFDLRTGARRWQAGEGEVLHQTPSLLTLGGREQIIVPTQTAAFAVDPRDGAVLWAHDYGQRASDAHAVRASGDRFLMTRSDFAVLHEIGADEAGLTIREVWRSGELKDNHSVPVHVDGHFYGFNGRFLTCVSEETGEDLWKSRPPGGHTITLLEDHLLISARGALVAVAADPRGYRETGRIPVFERADPYTPPSYSGGRVYLRDLEELVVLDVAAGPAGARVARDDDSWGQPAEGTRFAAFLAGLRQAAPDERPAAVEAWLERQRRFPVREGDWVHIVFRGDVPDLGLQGDLTGWMTDEAMHRVEATDFYYSSHRVPPATRIDYVLKLFDEAMPDPRNPDRVTVLGEEHSTVATEGWAPSPDTAEVPLRGRFEERTLRSGLFDEEVAMKVYLPPGYDEGDAAYPLAILGHGTAALESGLAGHVLSNRIGETVEPLVAVFMEMPTMRWAVWYQQRTGNRIVEFLDRELLPFLDEGYRLDIAPERRALIGQEETSDASILVPLAIPHRIAAATAQSGFAELVEMQQQVMPGFGSPATRGVRLRLEWSRYDRSRRLQAYDSRRTSAWLAAQLAAHGPQHLVVETTRGGSWGHWRHGLGQALEWLFPLDPTP